jgi:hypothetical protein
MRRPWRLLSRVFVARLVLRVWQALRVRQVLWATRVLQVRHWAISYSAGLSHLPILPTPADPDAMWVHP